MLDKKSDIISKQYDDLITETIKSYMNFFPHNNIDMIKKKHKRSYKRIKVRFRMITNIYKVFNSIRIFYAKLRKKKLENESKMKKKNVKRAKRHKLILP